MDRERRNRIGRNDPCHCGSGKKFKRCHGQSLDSIPPLPPSVIPPEVMQRFMERHKADELRRESQQGLGRPIIGTKFKDYQFVAVGNRVHYGKWGTFYDFLGDYIRQVLTPEWGNSEITKPLAERHPILQWYDAVCALQRRAPFEPGEVRSAPMTGWAATSFVDTELER